MQLQELNVDQWTVMRDFFMSVAHHRHLSTKEEFVQWLNALEGFLLDKLVPRTFQNFDAIDRLIEEAEKDD